MRTAGPGNGHVPLHRHAAVAADSGHDGQVGHEVRDAAEVVSEHPVSTTRYDRDNHKARLAYLFFMKTKLKVLLNAVLIKSARQRLKMKMFVTLLIFLFSEQKNQFTFY